MTGDSADADSLDPGVVVVGGGPAGAAAAIFTARYGLDTAVFDRGTGSLDRCAFLTNYPGFPAGIDVETFQALTDDHVREAGADLVTDLVESVRRDDGDGRFVVETQDGRRVTADRVVAATRYDGSYLAALDDDGMFQTVEHHGETRERFDPDYPDADGRTPVDGLYVASPAGERDVQAIVAAGRGAHVARSLVEDVRTEQGYPGKLARHYDWLRPESEFEGEWGDRDRWRAAFDERLPDDAALSGEHREELREAHVDRVFETKRSESEVAALTERSHQRLAEALDTDAMVAAVDGERVLAAMPDETIRGYLDGDEDGAENGSGD